MSTHARAVEPALITIPGSDAAFREQLDAGQHDVGGGAAHHGGEGAPARVGATETWKRSSGR